MLNNILVHVSKDSDQGDWSTIEISHPSELGKIMKEYSKKYNCKVALSQGYEHGYEIRICDIIPD